MMHVLQQKVLHPELSYVIVGILFKIHNELGNKYQERYYQRAVEAELKKCGLRYVKELEAPLLYDKQKIGKYFLDFFIEGKVVLELKAVPRISATDFNQVSAYLKATGIELGILANFRPASLRYYRILNPALRNRSIGNNSDN